MMKAVGASTTMPSICFALRPELTSLEVL